MKIEAFVIHLARASRRRAQVERIIAACPLKTHIVDAVDGRLLDDASRAAVYRKGLFTPRYPFELTLGEIGCFLSHRRAWQEIVSCNLDAGFIFEDDVEVDAPGFANAFELAGANIDRHPYIQFQVRPLNGAIETIVARPGVALVQPAVPPLRTSAQLVDRRAAKILLAATEIFDRPIDGFIQMYWETGIAVACAVPSGVSDRTRQTGGSTISSSKNLTKRIGWEYNRWTYRNAIRRLAMKHFKARTNA